MRLLRNLIPIVSLILLLGFSFASFEDTFFCSDADESESSHAEDCCTPCLTIHTMALNAQSSHIINNTLANSRFFFTEISFQNDPALFRIDRPPIS